MNVEEEEKLWYQCAISAMHLFYKEDMITDIIAYKACKFADRFVDKIRDYRDNGAR